MRRTEDFSQFRQLGLVALIVLIIILTGAFSPRFFSIESLRSVLLYLPLLILVGMGEMTVIITRGIDASVGSMVGVAGMLIGMIFRTDIHFPIFAAFAVSTFIGLILGSLNGYLVAFANVPSIMVTLGGFNAYRGLAFLASGGHQINGFELPASLMRFSQKGPFGLWAVPWIVFFVAVVAVLTSVFLRYTRTGRDIYAIGNNPEAARIRGVRVKRVLFFVYAFTGAMAGCAGILYASLFGFLNPGQTGVGLELEVIAAVVIGGVSVSGGTGSVVKVVIGCILLAVVNTSLSTLGIAGTWQQAVYGFVILVAITFDFLLKRRVTGMKAARKAAR
jgi:rhamnose transport system permease protein